MYNVLLSPAVANEHVEFIGLLYITASHSWANYVAVESTSSRQNMNKQQYQIT